jgi:hypothetical protein
MSDPDGADLGGDLPPLEPELAAWLTAEPTPTMPPQVWAQIEARLAEEPAHVPAGVVDLAAERKARTRRRALPLLAGAAGLALVGAVVVPALRSSDPAPLADGAPASTPAEVAALPSSTPLATTPEPAAPPLPRAMVATGTDYTAADFQTQATTLLASAGMQDSASIASAMNTPPMTEVISGEGLAASPQALADCLKRLGLSPESIPLVVDTATVDGRVGSLIVTWDPRSEETPLTVHAVAVGQECNEEDAASAMHWDVALP